MNPCSGEGADIYDRTLQNNFLGARFQFTTITSTGERILKKTLKEYSNTCRIIFYVEYIVAKIVIVESFAKYILDTEI